MRLLISCYEPKGYGGAATVAYELCRVFQHMGVDAGYLNIINDFDADYFRYHFGADFTNPENLENVFTSYIDGEQFYNPQQAVIQEVGKFKPDVILALHYIAPLVLKTSVPEIPLIYLTAGCKQAQIYLEKNGFHDSKALIEYLQALDWPPRIFNHEELKAVELADLVITHSNQTKQFYHFFFSQAEGKIHNKVFWLHPIISNHVRNYQSITKSFFERSIDVLFVASDWSRSEKNYPYVEAIAADLPGKNIHIVGEIPYTIPGVTSHGIIADPKYLYDLMGDSKTLASPSRLDAAPGILSEAAVMGCNLVASRNCGNWKMCNPELVVEDFTPQGFNDKIKISLSRKLPDRSSEFGSATISIELLELLKLAAVVNWD